jgi:hypothetical protein
MSILAFQRPFKLRTDDGIELPSWKFPRGAIFTCLSAGQRHDKLERLIGQYKTLPTREMSDAHRAAEAVIEDIIKGSQEREPSWSDVERMERALLTLLTGDDLKRFGWKLRAEFQRAIKVVPADEILAKAYEDSKPAPLDEQNEPKLKADLLALQAQLHELCGTRRIQIRARNLIACLTVFLGMVAVLIALKLDEVLHIQTIIFDVFGVGMLGGLFSTLIRIQKFRLGGLYEANALTASGNQIAVILAPAIGGTGAVVLFVVLAAGFLKGTFFPELSVINFSPETDFLEELFNVHVASSPEAAKLYLLCFLAGFSERLVPDVLSRLSSMAEKQRG